MKSKLIRWSATLGLVGSTLVGTWLGFSGQGLALPPEQVLQKLNGVPVFVVGNDQGNVFLASGENNKKVFVFYLSQQDAQKTADQVAKTNPTVKVQVIPLPLGAVYQITKDKKDTPDKPDLFNFVPMNSQLPSALTLLQQQDPKAKDFPGVPVFYAMFKKDKQDSYLSFKDGDKNLTPFYFEKESLLKIVEQFKQQQPNLGGSIEIKVVPLQNLISVFETGDDDFTRSIVLVPPRDSAELIQKAIQSQQQNQSKPTNTTPATPKK